jgi:hypothetical protein
VTRLMRGFLSLVLPITPCFRPRESHRDGHMRCVSLSLVILFTAMLAWTWTLLSLFCGQH